MNKSTQQLAVAVGAALLVAACASPGQVASQREVMLASAGFVPQRADNAARSALLNSLPPQQFVARTANGRTRYLYADPTACGCVYVGDRTAFDRYRQEVAAKGEEVREILSSTPLPGEEGLP